MSTQIASSGPTRLVEQRRAELTDEMQTFQARVDAFDEAAAQQLGVTRTDLRCIEILVRDGRASPGELGPALGLSSGGVTAMLIRLERQGYVRREPDPADGRRVNAVLTDRARRAAWELYGPIAEAGARMISHYSARELQRLTDFLRSARELYEENISLLRS